MQILATASGPNIGACQTDTFTIGHKTTEAGQPGASFDDLVTARTGAQGESGLDSCVIETKLSIINGQAPTVGEPSCPTSGMDYGTDERTPLSSTDLIPGDGGTIDRARRIVSIIRMADGPSFPWLTEELVELGNVGLQGLYEIFFKRDFFPPQIAVQVVASNGLARNISKHDQMTGYEAHAYHESSRIFREPADTAKGEEIVFFADHLTHNQLQTAIISHCDNAQTAVLGQRILERIISDPTIISDKNAAHYCELMVKIIRGALTGGFRVRPNSSLRPEDDLAVRAVNDLPLNVAALMLEHMSATGAIEPGNLNLGWAAGTPLMEPAYRRMREAFLSRPELSGYSLGKILDHQANEGDENKDPIALARKYLLAEADHSSPLSKMTLANPVDRMKVMLRDSTIDSDPFGAFTLLNRDWYPDQLASRSNAREGLFHLNPCSPEDLSRYFRDFRSFRRAVGATWDQEFKKLKLLDSAGREPTEEHINIDHLRVPLRNIARQDPANRNRELARKILGLQDTLCAWKNMGYVERFLTGTAVFGLNRKDLDMSPWQRLKLLLAATLA